MLETTKNKWQLLRKQFVKLKDLIVQNKENSILEHPWTHEEIDEYKNLFKICKNIVGRKIEQIRLYLEEGETEYSEQPNIYGISLFYGIEIIIEGEVYCLGNFFFNHSYNGLNILHKNLAEVEFIEDRKLVLYPSKIIGKQILSATIYWSKSHCGNFFVPQEIEISSSDELLLFSAIEVNRGEVNTELTDELLIVESKHHAQICKLGKYGIDSNGRYVFDNLDELMALEKELVKQKK